MVVRMRSTRGHTGNRRSHHALSPVRLSACPECKSMHLRHSACPNCGKYKGRVVVDVLAKIAKAEKKAKAKEKEATAQGKAK